ncbi:hypothetical protein ANMWB30_24970 [Arthrobacter sp. MWB30]|nr:hypothetical protein ANMWB30_24970 [Arthrobacter sp. MWB30]
MDAFNKKIVLKRALGTDKALQQAALRFLAPGEELSEPRQLDLARWPYSGLEKIPYNVSPATREQILRMDTLCVWCRKEASTTIDHVHPLSRGGTNNQLNLVGACEPCNTVKADFLPSELGWKLRLPIRAFALGAQSSGTDET